jgi:hypothetical protein
VKGIPKYVEIELIYPYLETPIIYVFERRRKKDADMEDRERMMGDGKRMTPANKMSQLIENIVGFPEFDPRDFEKESEQEFRERVFRFFNNEDGQEFAEDALLGRQVSVSPKPLFRSVENNRVEVNMGGDAPGGEPVLHLRAVPPTGEGPEERLSEVRVDGINKES